MRSLGLRRKIKVRRGIETGHSVVVTIELFAPDCAHSALDEAHDIGEELGQRGATWRSCLRWLKTPAALARSG